MQKVMEHRNMPKSTPLKMIISSKINKTIPWAYFDGSNQGDPALGGAGGVAYLIENKKIEIIFSLSRASNNKEELIALWIVLRVSINKHLKNIQLFGDSKMVIEWANGII